MNQQALIQLSIDHCTNKLILYGNQSKQFRSSIESAAISSHTLFQVISQRAHQRAAQINTAPPVIDLPGPIQTRNVSKRPVNADKDRFRRAFKEGRILLHMAPITNLNDVRVIQSTDSVNTLQHIANARSRMCLDSSCIAGNMQISAQYSDRSATQCIHDGVGLWYFQQPGGRITYDGKGFIGEIMQWCLH
jgi:hypothetical protein